MTKQEALAAKERGDTGTERNLADEYMQAMARIELFHESDCACRRLKVYCEVAELLRAYYKED